MYTVIYGFCMLKDSVEPVLLEVTLVPVKVLDTVPAGVTLWVLVEKLDDDNYPDTPDSTSENDTYNHAQNLLTNLKNKYSFENDLS